MLLGYVVEFLGSLVVIIVDSKPLVTVAYLDRIHHLHLGAVGFDRSNRTQRPKLKSIVSW